MHIVGVLINADPGRMKLLEEWLDIDDEEMAGVFFGAAFYISES